MQPTSDVLPFVCTENGIQISALSRCDGSKDCPNGEDESDCVKISQDPFETWTNGDDHKEDLPTSSKYGVALAASLSAVLLLILLILLIIVLVNWIKRRNESYHKEELVSKDKPVRTGNCIIQGGPEGPYQTKSTNPLSQCHVTDTKEPPLQNVNNYYQIGSNNAMQIGKDGNSFPDSYTGDGLSQADEGALVDQNTEAYTVVDVDEDTESVTVEASLILEYEEVEHHNDSTTAVSCDGSIQCPEETIPKQCQDVTSCNSTLHLKTYFQ